MNFSRQNLHQRHRLSHQQIDKLLNEMESADFTEEKMQQMEKLRFFHKFTSELRERDIKFWVLKGPILSDRIYGDPTCRLMNDFDILIEPDSVDLLTELLTGMNFHPRDFQWPESTKREKIAQHITNQIGYYNSENGVLVEVHWRLFNDRVSDHAKSWQLIKENTEIIEFAGKPFHRFNIEFELLYLVIHGSIHGWFRLKWLVDIHEMLKRYPFNENHFNELVGEMNAGRFVDVCNAMLSEYFPGSKRLPAQNTNITKLESFAKEQVERSSDELGDTIFHTLSSIRYRMALTDNIQYKLDLLKLFAICKTDLNYKWIPPYKTAFYLFRPFGYLYRALIKLKKKLS